MGAAYFHKRRIYFSLRIDLNTGNGTLQKVFRFEDLNN